MNIKSRQEKDPAQCRILRQAERQIKSDIETISAALSSIFSELKDFRKLRSDLGDKAKDPKVQIAVLTAASRVRGAIGHVIGSGAASLTTELEVLRSRIDALNRQIETTKQKSEDHKYQ